MGVELLRFQTYSLPAVWAFGIYLLYAEWAFRAPQRMLHKVHTLPCEAWDDDSTFEAEP